MGNVSVEFVILLWKILIIETMPFTQISFVSDEQAI